MQKQLVIELNYFSCDNGADEQLLAYCARVKVCVAAVFRCPARGGLFEAFRFRPDEEISREHAREPP